MTENKESKEQEIKERLTDEEFNIMIIDSIKKEGKKRTLEVLKSLFEY